MPLQIRTNVFLVVIVIPLWNVPIMMCNFKPNSVLWKQTWCKLSKLKNHSDEENKRDLNGDADFSAMAMKRFFAAQSENRASLNLRRDVKTLWVKRKRKFVTLIFILSHLSLRSESQCSPLVLPLALLVLVVIYVSFQKYVFLNELLCWTCSPALH